MIKLTMITLIQKYTKSEFFWPKLVKKKKIEGLSVQEIIQKYQGFEGELISSFSKLKDIPITLSLNQLILYISSDPKEIPPQIKESFLLVGYDFGTCEEDYTIYSSIFNEVLFGSNKDLIAYKNKLNEFFLFPNRNLAKQYATLHHKLLLQKEDVEDDSDMKIYEIWKYKNEHLNR